MDKNITVYYDGTLYYESLTMGSALAKIRWRLEVWNYMEKGYEPITIVDNTISDERLDELLEDASREAEKRGESDVENKKTKSVSARSFFKSVPGRGVDY